MNTDKTQYLYTSEETNNSNIVNNEVIKKYGSYN